MHIFKYGLRTNDTKVRCNVVYKLAEPRRAVCSTNMKVSFMRGDLPMRRASRTSAFKQFSAHHEPAYVIRTQHEKPALVAFIEG